MTARFARLVLGLTLSGAALLCACQLPAKVGLLLSGAQPAGSATPVAGGEYQESGVPSPGAGSAYPKPGAEYPYPGAYPDSGAAHGLNPTQLGLTMTAIAYPEPGIGEPPAEDVSATGTWTPTPSATLDSAYPQPGTVTPTPSATSEEAYPGATIMPTWTPTSGDAYPGATIVPTWTPTSGDAYPGATVVPTWTPTPTPGAAYPGLTTGSPTPTGTPALSGTPTLTSTPSPIPTATPTFTRTPFLTPTPTLTRTPTITPTPLPPPPWVSAELRATDPKIVRLASGRVQLVEFFAFWSGTSQAMAPIVHGLQAEYGASMNFVYLDIDDPANEDFMRELIFRMEPHFFLLDAQGRVIRQWIGYVSRQQFIQAFNAALGR